MTNICRIPQEVLERHFGAFGRIVKLTMLHTRNLAFVKYANRLSAEFAKEAMSDQSLDNNEVGVDGAES